MYHMRAPFEMSTTYKYMLQHMPRLTLDTVLASIDKQYTTVSSTKNTQTECAATT